MNPQTSKEGFLFVDHRASPGLTPEMARRMGYPGDLVKALGEGKLLETATLRCAHCTTIVIKSRTATFHNCVKCGNSFICNHCHAQMQLPDYIHTPIEKLRDDRFNAAVHNPDFFTLLSGKIT